MEMDVDVDADVDGDGIEEKGRLVFDRENKILVLQQERGRVSAVIYWLEGAGAGRHRAARVSCTSSPRCFADSCRCMGSRCLYCEVE
jgi:hypothetical protein